MEDTRGAFATEAQSGLDRITSGSGKWRPSRYNLFAPIPGTDLYAGINLFHGSCDTYTQAELYLLSEVEFLHSGHPILSRFRERGLIVNFDERKALDCLERLSPAAPYSVGLTICPTMGCNFRCPYCFVEQRNGRMSREVQDDVAALAGRMLDASNAKQLRIRWFGGEPLLAPEIVEELSPRLIRIAGERGAAYKAWMYTNGYLLTQETVDMLDRCRIERITVSVDGIGGTHDRTRPLAGGGPTFSRITENLRSLRIPFRVEVRQNLYRENRKETEALRELVDRIREESGNRISFTQVPVSFSHMKDGKYKRIYGLSEEEYFQYNIRKIAKRFGPARANCCPAGSMWDVGVNAEGRLFSCWEKQDDIRFSFGSAHRWNPLDPIRTADQPDLFTAFINLAGLPGKPECRECVWYPVCYEGCPLAKIECGPACVPWKNRSEDFVMAVYEEKAVALPRK